MIQYLQIIQKEIPKVSDKDIYTPIHNTDIDSLDLLVIRVALEKYFCIEIPDSIWYSYQTLSEALEYFHKNKRNDYQESITEIPILKSFEKVEIRMPQMAKSALSENWLLKYLGDAHWQLISKGFDRKSSEFVDDNGNRLYSTFVRINLITTPINQFYENEIIDFSAQIESFGNNTFLSEIKGVCGEKNIVATLMTTFSIRENENNNIITKCNPIVKSKKISQITKTPLFFNDYRLIKKSLLETISTNFGKFNFSDKTIFSTEYKINPFYEINGVGLLYFASYPIIVDNCLMEYDRNYEFYNTVFRDIFYFANSNSNDLIIFSINNIETNNNQIKTVTSLHRKSDKNLIARILTVKEKTLDN